FDVPQEISVSVPNITIAGHGMAKTILDFSEQSNGQGILATGDAFKLQDITIQNTSGDAVKVEGVDGAHMQRVRTVWTKGSSKENGAYGFYPVFSKNVIIEGCVAIGASDAGIYVGQTDKAVVRNNIVEYNVAGIEIENVDDSEVHNNWVAYNTTGVLIFDAPYIKGNTGRSKMFKNVVYKNNGKNYGAGFVGVLPPGLGVVVMAIDDVQVTDNLIRDHITVPVAVVSTAFSGLAKYDQNADDDLFPENTYVYNNRVENLKGFYFNPDNDLNLFINMLSLFDAPEIIYDGAGENFKGTSNVFCQNNNQDQFGYYNQVGNVNLTTTFLDFLGAYLPGGFIERNPADLNCKFDELTPLTVDATNPIPDDYSNPFVIGSENELCQLDTGETVNWSAYAVNCPNLSDYNLFSDATDPKSTPHSNGQPYDLTTPLFSDYSKKHRVIFVPENQKAVYNDSKEFEFPVGSIIAKNFSMQDESRVIETRLMIRRAEGWVGLPYIWNEENTEAKLSLGGGTVVATVNNGTTTLETNYQVPNANQCITCHGQARGKTAENGLAIREVVPLGIQARWLNKDYDYGDDVENQLIHIAKAGILQGVPLSDFENVPSSTVWNDPSDGTLDERARDYLDMNCAHCHSPDGFAASTGVSFKVGDNSIGVCKSPVAAGPGTGGLAFDIVPGDASKSILSFRMTTDEPGAKMPELGRSVTHLQGVELIDAWINNMPADDCRANPNEG
ncbi:MAG: SO2930 family diheme c-type cytochrome, partial [Pseudomonadota bacterium]